ncbi:MAG TPA: oxidoreductase [Desulfobacteraceae bacterium]|nr:oxidoreductase [Desulfobacteraceae bacterium]
MESAEIVVIGAGPAGIAVGVEGARAGIERIVILEKSEYSCDTIVSLYREGKRVDAVYRNVSVAPQGALAFETKTKESFLAWMEEVIDTYKLDIRNRHEVLDVRKNGDRFLVQCGNQAVFEAPFVVIAIGIFGKPVKPSYPIPREVRDKVFFSIPEQPPAGKKVLVVGGGDSAAEAACFLSQSNKVTLSYRRSEFFRINEPNLCTLNQCCTYENLETKLGVDITGIAPEGERVRVAYSGGEEVAYDAVFYFLGGSTPRAFLQKAGVTYSKGRPVVDASGESGVPGLFLAGDLVAEKGSIMAAFNSAAAVVGKIQRSLSAASIKA